MKKGELTIWSRPRLRKSDQSESMKDIDEQAFWSPCQMKAPQDMVLRMAAAATGKQYGGYWTHPPVPKGEIQENQRMEAAVAAVKNRKEKDQPSTLWKFGEGFTLKGDDKPDEVEWNEKEAVWKVKNRKEKEEKFQVLQEPRRFKSLPLEGPNPEVRQETARVKRKVQNLEGHRVRTESEPAPPRRHGRASGCTPYSGTARPLPLEPLPPPPRPLEPLQGPQPLPQGPQPPALPQRIQGGQDFYLACTLCGRAEGRLNCKNSWFMKEK